MPGKVNPVTLESVIQAGIKVIANDQIVTECVARGSLQINEFMPLLSLALLETFDLLLTANKMLAQDIVNVTADQERCSYYLDRAETIVAAFVPIVGYGRVTELLKEFSGREQDNLREFLEEKLGPDMVARVLDPHNLTALGYRDDAHNT